jgi:hypothetical protein
VKATLMSDVIQVNVLTDGCSNPNGCAFLYPLIRYKKALLDRGIYIRFVTDIEQAVRDCDVLLVENKYFGPRWASEKDTVLSDLQWCKERVASLIYVSITDSTGWDHADALPIVTAYLKNQLLRDRNRYLKPMYGYRPFTDYYNKHFSVEDNQPAISVPVSDPALLGKLGVGWNSGLADWSLHGPLKMALYRRLHWKGLLREPGGWSSPSATRENDISCRFGSNYARSSVAWQRKQIRKIMAGQLGTDKLNRKGYFDELRHSKLVVSPFGLGEITLKDFEVFITGGLLFKPDMLHMETWPNLFVDGETMVTHSWDLTSFEERMDVVLSNYDNYIDIAREGQRRYYNTIVGEQAGEGFAEHLHDLLMCDWIN